MYEPVAFSFALRCRLYPGSAKKMDMFKDNLTEEQLVKLGLNTRQIKAVSYMKEKGKITNAEYQEINSVSKRTATNDLTELVTKCELANNTGFGAGSFYELIIRQ